MVTPAAILILLWGLAFGALPIAMQGWMLKAAPDEMESASAMFISVLQIGLASGSFLGGVVVDRFGLDATLVSAGCAALTTAALVWLFGGAGSATRPVEPDRYKPDTMIDHTSAASLTGKIPA